MNLKKFLIIVIFDFHCRYAFSQSGCTNKNFAFREDEEMVYAINYNWGFVWLHAGEAVFKTELINQNGKLNYHLSGNGYTYPKYDWFYKVRDTYEAYSDTGLLKSQRFKRNAYEAGNQYSDDYVFNHYKKIIYSSMKRRKAPFVLDSVAFSGCLFDPITAIYHCRNIDFSRYKIQDTIPVTLVLENKIYPVYIRYLGKETIKTDLWGEVKCIKFRAKLISGTLFKEGENMLVWVTDDMNRVPVYVETPIVVGSIKVKLTKIKNLKNPSILKRVEKQ